MSGPTRFAQLPRDVQDRLRGTARRLRLARLLVEVLPVANDPLDGLTQLELVTLTGYDRVDVGNALALLRELEVAARAGGKVGRWSLHAQVPA